MVSSGSWFLVKNVPFPSDILVRIKIFTEWVLSSSLQVPQALHGTYCIYPVLWDAMCSNVEDFTFFNFISLFSSFLPCFLYMLWFSSCHQKKWWHMHLQRCLSLDPECAFKAKLSVLVHFGALLYPVKLSGSAGSGFFHMKNRRPATCLIQFTANGHSLNWSQSYPK